MLIQEINSTGHSKRIQGLQRKFWFGFCLCISDGFYIATVGSYKKWRLGQSKPIKTGLEKEKLLHIPANFFQDVLSE